MQETEKRLMARPTKYTPSLGVKILEHMENGLSILAACGEVDIGRSTVYRWIDEYPEFAELIELGQTKRLAWLEKRATGESLTGPQATVTIFALKNADKSWRQDNNHAVELTGANGGPIALQAIAFRVIDNAQPLVIEHQEDERMRDEG